jgi:UDP-3-O-[3-hydroxymyristoyl] glucosamine N-acyltransferase
MVTQNARVYEEASVGNMSCVSENARICGRAKITECSQVLGNSYVDEGRITGTVNYYGDTSLDRKKGSGMELG